MGKDNPRAWFTGPIARICYRKVDKWAERNSKFRPYFPTWEEAHEWMMERALERLKRAQAELKSAGKHLEKIKALEKPHD